MGYALLITSCVRCKRIFGCNPHLVPSIRIDGDGIPSPAAPRQPICQDCHQTLNQVRIDHGMEPWPEPLPGAYEAIDEGEL